MMSHPATPMGLQRNAQDTTGTLRRDVGNVAKPVRSQVRAQPDVNPSPFVSRSAMLLRRAQVKSEFDYLMWEKHNADKRLDALAKEMESLDAEIAVAGLTADLTDIRRLPTFIEIEMIEDVRVNQG